MPRNGTGAAITCMSKNISTSLPYESNTSYVDGITTVTCDIDRTTGSNSSSSLRLKWIRDSVGGDGQYAYAYIDPTKKYRFSMDAKGTLNSAVN